MKLFMLLIVNSQTLKVSCNCERDSQKQSLYLAISVQPSAFRSFVTVLPTAKAQRTQRKNVTA